MSLSSKDILKRVLPVVIGGLAGYAYYYFIGCYNGTCPIQSNPYISTLYGMAAGLIFVFPSRKKEPQN
ncbi:MAG: DUF6132 family protein [Ignavibacteriaceae bacterium]